MKLCRDCKHFLRAGEKCSEFPQLPDYVHGTHKGHYSAQIMRETSGYCGPEAKKFGPKEPA